MLSTGLWPSRNHAVEPTVEKNWDLGAVLSGSNRAHSARVLLIGAAKAARRRFHSRISQMRSHQAVRRNEAPNPSGSLGYRITTQRTPNFLP
jgi:hypothetical protein